MHTWRWGEPNHGPAEIPTNGEEWGMGAVPGVTHLKTSKKAFHSSDTSAPHLMIKTKQQPHVLPLFFFCSEPKAGLKTNDEPCRCPDFRFNCLYNKKLDSHPSHFLTAAVVVFFFWITELFHCSACHETTTERHSFPSPLKMCHWKISPKWPRQKMQQRNCRALR